MLMVKAKKRTRSPIELFWIAKNEEQTSRIDRQIPINLWRSIVEDRCYASKKTI